MDWAQMKTAETIGVGSRVNSPMLTEHSQCGTSLYTFLASHYMDLQSQRVEMDF